MTHNDVLEIVMTGNASSWVFFRLLFSAYLTMAVNFCTTSVPVSRRARVSFSRVSRHLMSQDLDLDWTKDETAYEGKSRSAGSKVRIYF